MIGLTISPRGLGVFLFSRVECSVTLVEDPTRGTLVRVWRATADATTVARRATLGRIVPPLLGQQHALQFRLLTSISGEIEATGLRRRAECTRCQGLRHQAQVTWLWVVA